MARRTLVLAAVGAACSAAAEAPPAPWLYPAPRPAWPQPPVRARIGAADVPIALVGEGLVAGPGVAGGPLAMQALVGAENGAAEAALSGDDAQGPAIDLVDVDAGVVRWRNRTAGLPAVAIVGGDVIAAGGETIVVLDRASGAERERLEARWIGAGPAQIAVGLGDAVALYAAGVLGPARAVPGSAADVVAVCDGWLLAWRGGSLQRWDEAGEVFAVTWSAAVPRPVRADCRASPLLVCGGGVRAVHAIDPASGAIAGGPIAAADFWPARDGDGVELATAAGIERRDRSLGGASARERVAINRLIAARGGRRLVLGADGGPVLLDGHGARALAAPAGDPIVVAGERSLLAGPWRAAPAQRAQPARFAWPPDHLSAAPGPRPSPPLLGDPPRVDLPAARPLGRGVVADAGAEAVGAVAFDPDDPERLYAVVLGDPARGAAVASFDLHADRWRWVAPDGCAPGTPIALAATAGAIACGARDAAGGEVRAIRTADGAPAWAWRGAAVDAVVAAGGAIAIAAGAEAVILDAATGAERGRWRASDGFAPRLALVRRGADTRVASLEHGAIVTRSLALELLPIDATAAGGRVIALAAIGDTVTAALGDGSLYLFDDGGRGRAAGALSPAWLPRGLLAFAIGTNALGDAIVVAVDDGGVPRLAVAIAGVEVAELGARSDAPDAPVALAAADGRALVVDLDGRVRAIAALSGAGGLFATVVDGAPVAGVVLAKPLRVIRFELE